MKTYLKNTRFGESFICFDHEKKQSVEIYRNESLMFDDYDDDDDLQRAISREFNDVIYPRSKAKHITKEEFNQAYISFVKRLNKFGKEL